MRGRRGCFRSALTVASILAVLVAAAPVWARAAESDDGVGSITEFPVQPGDFVDGIAAGPDGALWFCLPNGGGLNRIGRMTTSGKYRTYPVPTQNSDVFDIVAGPDGNMWFTEYLGDRIGRITPSGTVTEYPITPLAWPRGITVGPDGALWFTETNGWTIGRLTTSRSLTEWAGSVGAKYTDIAPGPDGNLWFTDYRGNKIGEGPDGNLWFGEAYGWAVGRVTDAPAPAISVDPTSGEPGTELTVSGSGYGALEHVRLHFIDSLGTRSLLGVRVTDSSGHLSATVSVPAGAAAGHGAVHARGPVSGFRAGAPFLVT